MITNKNTTKTTFTHSAIVIADPTGSGPSRDLDDRVYQCLNSNGCGNQGSVNSGAFKRQGRHDTACVACGSEFNRWIRDAAVSK